jgi:hypothetical protein
MTPEQKLTDFTPQIDDTEVGAVDGVVPTTSEEASR